MNRLRHWLDGKTPGQRLFLGLALLLLAIVCWFTIDTFNTGFFGGFITGILLALGIGLTVTYKNQ